MEYAFSSKEKGINYWASTSTQPGIPIGEARNNDDPYTNVSEMMTLDGYADNLNFSEQLLTSYGFSSLPSMPPPPNYSSYDHLNFSEQSNCLNVLGNPLGFLDKMVFSHSDNAHFGLPEGSSNENGSDVKQDYMSLLVPQGKIPRPLRHSLSERMLRALSLFKESSEGGILAQVWVPMRDGDNYILSTCEQPYLLDQMLVGYREVSRSYTFSIEEKPGSFPGLPGRVFMSKIPEWTSDVNYYSSAEYLRVKHAHDHQVHGSVAIPIFSSTEMSCCAVLELVTVKEKPNFDSELQAVCRALEAVDLRTTTPPRLLPQHLSVNQRTALVEITDVLRAICHSHRLPLALTWIPCTLKEDGDDIITIQVRDCDSNLDKKPVLCIEETACYVNNKDMQGFAHTCAEHFLEQGQGVAGKALQSNLPSFTSDVKNYHINEYPLVQHARKFRLNAAVAIRLRSTYTGNDDYILEFFLPLNMKGTKEQQLLLDSLSGTMQRICRSLRTVSDAELDRSVSYEAEECRHIPMMSSHGIDTMSLDTSATKNESIESSGSFEQASVLRRHADKKRSVTEKTVNLSVLQQYFSGSLKDAAKNIGVCPTTLKRICRQHGISRWPSRKINKVNRSLRKIQTVLDSVEGVEGGLKFDPRTGELVASGSVIQEFDTHKNLFFPNKILAVKLEEDSYMTGKEEQKKSNISNNCNSLPWKYGEDAKNGLNQWNSSINEMDVGMENDNGIVEHNDPSTSSMTDSSNMSGYLPSTPNSIDNQNQSKDKTSMENGGLRSITVKATYRDDMIRFKFDPSSGYLHMYEEVASRFKIQLGTFQLKYLDDEEEWVMLVSQSDLQECLEVMEFVGKQSIKLLVRDLPCGMGSSSSSNCFIV